MVLSEGNMSLKNPVTPPGMDPGTARLLVQRLNHNAIPGPTHTQCLRKTRVFFPPVKTGGKYGNLRALNFRHKTYKYGLNILLSTTNKIQRYTIFFIIVTALHVSGCFSAHHQELKNCIHSIWYVSGLLAATASGSSKLASS
jgi:hypothetical protein